MHHYSSMKNWIIIILNVLMVKTISEDTPSYFTYYRRSGLSNHVSHNFSPLDHMIVLDLHAKF